MCGGLFFAVLLWFVFFIGGAVFVVGLVLVLVSGQPAGRKALAIGFPFVAWVGIAAGAWALAPREPGLTFLIPEGFEGTVMVVKNEQCGPPPELENGRRLYRVPASGLLIVRDTVPNREHPYYNWPNRGYFLRPDNQYFVVNRQGRRLRELTEVQYSYETNRPEPTSSLFGSVGNDELAAFYDSPIESAPDSMGVGYTFQYVTITTPNHYAQPATSDAQYRVRTLADSLVTRCRVRIGQPPQGIRKPKPNPFAAPLDSTAH